MTKRTEFRCDACNQSLNKVPLAPMLRDGVWNSVAGPQETLCARCLFERMTNVLDRMPCFADLRPCVFNLLHAPHSWLDLFISKEKRHLFSMMSGTRCLGNRLRSTASEREGGS
jgi:hypothetical protein